MSWVDSRPVACDIWHFGFARGFKIPSPFGINWSVATVSAIFSMQITEFSPSHHYFTLGLPL